MFVDEEENLQFEDIYLEEMTEEEVTKTDTST